MTFSGPTPPASPYEGWGPDGYFVSDPPPSWAMGPEATRQAFDAAGAKLNCSVLDYRFTRDPRPVGETNP